MVTAQLRTYRIEAGRMEEFVRLWREGVVPIRRRHGFRVEGAWTVVGEDRFVWIISHDGDFEEADRAYYSAPERQALRPDPADLIEEAEHHLMRPVE